MEHEYIPQFYGNAFVFDLTNQCDKVILFRNLFRLY